jgi:hypothetical protein
LLELRKFGDESKSFRDQIEEWGGFGQFMIDQQAQYPFLDMEVDDSGHAKLEMSDGFVRHVQAILGMDQGQELPKLDDFCGATGLKVTATLHTNLEDPEVKASKLDVPSKLKAQTALPYPMLFLKFEGEIKRADHEPSVNFEGAALFQPMIKVATDGGEE